MKVYLVERLGKIQENNEIIDTDCIGVFDSIEKAKCFILDWLDRYDETIVGKDIYWGINKNLNREDTITVNSYEVA